ncbi:MAG: hypothetical protein FWG93_08535, partial [Oscillospiraceae bacterium]|nr:hypothetical protein [Oscillospiraceae bacterium]
VARVSDFSLPRPPGVDFWRVFRQKPAPPPRPKKNKTLAFHVKTCYTAFAVFSGEEVQAGYG